MQLLKILISEPKRPIFNRCDNHQSNRTTLKLVFLTTLLNQEEGLQ